MSILDDEDILLDNLNEIYFKKKISEWIKNHCDLRRGRYKIECSNGKYVVDTYGHFVILPFTSHIPIELFTFRKVCKMLDYYDRDMDKYNDDMYYAGVAYEATFDIGYIGKPTQIKNLAGLPYMVDESNQSYARISLNECDCLKSYKELSKDILKYVIIQRYDADPYRITYSPIKAYNHTTIRCKSL